MTRIMPLDRGVHLAADALHAGEYTRRGAMTIEWDMAKRCRSPVTRELLVRPEPKLAALRGGGRVGYTVNKGENGGYNIHYGVACRRCDNCLRARRAVWSARATSETLASVRTWFGTLTLAPESHFRMLMAASARLRASGTSFEALGAEEQFRERHSEISKEITLWVKRVRKNSGAPLRFLVVTEAHQSGLPHYHALIHESDATKPVTYRQLSSAWPLGYVKFKLVDPGDVTTARYVTKYLAKNAMARVRASVAYGEPPFPTLGLGGVLADASGVNALPRIAAQQQREKTTPGNATEEPTHTRVAWETA